MIEQALQQRSRAARSLGVQAWPSASMTLASESHHRIAFGWIAWNKEKPCERYIARCVRGDVATLHRPALVWSRRWRMSNTCSIPRRSSSSRTSVTSRRRASCQQASGSYFEVPTREALFGGHIGSAVVVELNHRSMSVHIGFHPMYCVSGAHLPQMCMLLMLSLSLSHV